MKLLRFINSNLKQAVSIFTIIALFANSAFAATYYVDTNADNNPGTCVADENTNDDNCTFRNAVSVSASGDTITFLEDMIIANSGSTYNINNDNISINNGGYTVELNGNNAVTNGISISGDNVTVDGLYMYDHNANAIQINSTADGTTIKNSTLGLDPLNNVKPNNRGINSSGDNVTLQNNVISGNTVDGVALDPGSSDILITGNKIGTDSTGLIDKGNGDNGIILYNGFATINGGDGGIEGLVIGGSTPAERNIISGNGETVALGDGIEINGTVNSDILIQGNYIGLGSDGSTVIPNNYNGISGGGSQTGTHWIIGTDGDGTNDATEGNVISGNLRNGIEINGGNNSIKVSGNILGMDATGTSNKGNSMAGIQASTETLIIGSDLNGVSDDLEGNVISANGSSGAVLFSQSVTPADETMLITGNKIGVNINGTGNHGNTGNGININSIATDNVQIGDSATEGTNTIGNNTINGISIINTQNDATIKIQNNNIGIEEDKTTPAGNGQKGINLKATAGYTPTVYIGADGVDGDDATEGNIISNNGTDGIYVDNGIGDVTIAGNKIGVAYDGVSGFNTPAGNTNAGINIVGNEITDVKIGGSTTNDRNIIGDNDTGIMIGKAGSIPADVLMENNYIGIGEDGSTNLGNNSYGIHLTAGALITIITNVISGNTIQGINIQGGINLVIQGNKIGTDATGLLPIGNGSGIYVNSPFTLSSLLIGGISSLFGNIIAGNTGTGINIVNVPLNTTPVTIQGNYIGVGGDGQTTAGMANQSTGISIIKGALTLGGTNDLANGNLNEGNVISNNTNYGVNIGTNVDSANIIGNIIGLVSDGINYNTSAGNSIHGIYINSANINDVKIGHSDAGKDNTISGNGNTGIFINNTADGATTIDIVNNKLGTNYAGTATVGNWTNAIYVKDGDVVTIGGTTASERNILSGTTIGAGIDIVIGAGIVNILGNYIGTAIDGLSALPNRYGIYLRGGSAVNIGDGNAGGGNVISGNTRNGIYINNNFTDNVSIQGNYIGLDATGETKLGNGSLPLYTNLYNQGGIRVEGGTNNVTIGGDDITDPNQRNVITGNYGQGILAQAPVRIKSNYIGTNKDGDTAVGNIEGSEGGAGNMFNGTGITVLDIAGNSVSGVIIGDDTSSEKRNVVSANEGCGIAVVHHDGSGGQAEGGGQDWSSGYIKGNYVGLAADGVTSLPNANNGLCVITDDYYTNDIQNLEIGNPANTFESSTTDKWGIYLYKIAETMLTGSYSDIATNNDFTVPAPYPWQYTDDSGVNQLNQCNDMVDNDGDGLIDGADYGCLYAPFAEDDISGNPECNDGIDNNGDGLIDGDDYGCLYPPYIEGDITGNPQCNDGIDNDGDGFIDYPDDPGCESLEDDDETTPVPPSETQGGSLTTFIYKTTSLKDEIPKTTEEKEETQEPQTETETTQEIPEKTLTEEPDFETISEPPTTEEEQRIQRIPDEIPGSESSISEEKIFTNTLSEIRHSSLKNKIEEYEKEKISKIKFEPDEKNKELLISGLNPENLSEEKINELNEKISTLYSDQFEKAFQNNNNKLNVKIDDEIMEINSSQEIKFAIAGTLSEEEKNKMQSMNILLIEINGTSDVDNNDIADLYEMAYGFNLWNKTYNNTDYIYAELPPNSDSKLLYMPRITNIEDKTISSQEISFRFSGEPLKKYDFYIVKDSDTQDSDTQDSDTQDSDTQDSDTQEITSEPVFDEIYSQTIEIFEKGKGEHTLITENLIEELEEGEYYAFLALNEKVINIVSFEYDKEKSLTMPDLEIVQIDKNNETFEFTVETQENVVLFFTYKSIVFSSVILSDAGQKININKNLGREFNLEQEHDIIVYAYNPEMNFMSSATKKILR